MINEIRTISRGQQIIQIWGRMGPKWYLLQEHIVADVGGAINAQLMQSGVSAISRNDKGQDDVY